ncbi:hypothetical protein OIU76_014154 [Salix suchowensis]|nr:hypothetical protein OIU76_014154 [Salix suchowensis]
MANPSQKNTSEYQTVISMTLNYHSRKVRLIRPFQGVKAWSTHKCPLNPLLVIAPQSRILQKRTAPDLIKVENIDSSEIYPVIDEDFWSEPEMVENSGMPSSSFLDDLQFPFPSSDSTTDPAGCYGYGPKADDNMDFWYNLFIKSGGIEELPVQYLQRYNYVADERI